MNNVHAKKRKAGPGEVGRVLDEAARWCTIDVVCGDLNMARWNGDLEWHDGTLEHLEFRDFMPIADYVGGDVLHRHRAHLGGGAPSFLLAPPATGPVQRLLVSLGVSEV